MDKHSLNKAEYVRFKTMEDRWRLGCTFVICKVDTKRWTLFGTVCNQHHARFDTSNTNIELFDFHSSFVDFEAALIYSFQRWYNINRWLWEFTCLHNLIPRFSTLKKVAPYSSKTSEKNIRC